MLVTCKRVFLFNFLEIQAQRVLLVSFLISDYFIYWVNNGSIQPVPFTNYPPFYLIFPQAIYSHTIKYKNPFVMNVTERSDNCH